MAQNMWKKAEVNEEKLAQLLQTLDYSIIQEMKDHAMADLLTEKVFGSEECSVFFVYEDFGDSRKKA